MMNKAILSSITISLIAFIGSSVGEETAVFTSVLSPEQQVCLRNAVPFISELEITENIIDYRNHLMQLLQEQESGNPEVQLDDEQSLQVLHDCVIYISAFEATLNYFTCNESSSAKDAFFKLLAHITTNNEDEFQEKNEDLAELMSYYVTCSAYIQYQEDNPV